MSLRFDFVLVLVIVYGTSYLLKPFERYDVPILVAEIGAGILFGSYLGIIGPGSPGYEFLLSMASFGLLLIMFDAGLELDPAYLRRQPRTVGILGVTTFVVPFLGGLGLGLALGVDTFAAYLIGVAVSTTSLGLVYPLLENFDYIDTEQGQLVLSVAVLNDILSVVALAYGIAATAANPMQSVTVVTAAVAVFFLVIPVFLVDHVARLIPENITTNPTKFGVFAAVLLAFAMEHLGVHAILGGFFAGVVLAEATHEGHKIERAMKPVVDLAAPVFFFVVGMQFHLGGFDARGLWLLAAVLIVGIGTKLLGAGLGGWLGGLERRTTKLLASSMPGRLSLSVAAAEIGRAQGLLSPTLYSSFIVLTVVSVAVASLLFRQFARGDAAREHANNRALGD